MRASPHSLVTFACSLLALAAGGQTVAAREATAREATAREATVMPLPDGVRAVWDVDAAYRESSQTRERVCLNGLWRWQPSRGDAESVPDTRWGYFKVPGSWPGITNYMQKDCQTVIPHPA
ncbi:MAG: hypothetical protein FJ276_24890, partial [Planctomycetes bacterium]|nr:hypothetical protein [Planctomycetota bacterium]